MVRPNPVQLETLFNETIRLIISAPSERVQLQLLMSFLDQINGYEQECESYLIQLFQKLPDFSNPLLYAGLNPKYLKDVIERLEVGISSIDQFQKSDEFEQMVFTYKKAMTQLYRWVGEAEGSDILEDAIAFSKGKEVKEIARGVLVPVVEQSKGIKSGRLRRLKVEIIGASKKGFEIKPTFGVIGANAGSFLKDAETAAGKLLQESRKGKNKYWIGTAFFDLSHAWHAGRSANLAIAGTFYCQMLRAEEQQEYFQLNPAICVTGDVDKSGKVLAVEESTLQQKIEAAFFSWVHVIVVPADQLLQTLQIVDQLKQEFPNRWLPVVGVTHIRELFFDRRLTLHHKTGAVAHNLKKAWKRKFSVASLLGFIVLLGIIASLVIGPIDRNPTLYNYEGTEIILMNQAGRELSRIEVTQNDIENGTSEVPAVSHDIITLIDVDNDGYNEVLLNLMGENGLHQSTLTLLSTNLQDTLWVVPLVFDIEFEKHPYAFIKGYRGRIIQIVDIDSDGTLEALVTAEQNMYFKGAFAVFDMLTGELEQTYAGAGWFSQLITEDFDQDGSRDVLVCGHFKGYEFYGCSLLDGKKIDGFSPLNERYYDKNKPQADAKLHFAWNGSIILNYLKELNRNQYAYPSIYAHSKFESDQLLALTFLEGVASGYDRDIPLNLIYTFDYHFNPIAIASSDYYDSKSKELFDEGRLPFLPDAEYLHTLRDSIYWWNGSDWTQEPTLNPAYLESVGDDSTYYKEWYFNSEN